MGHKANHQKWWRQAKRACGWSCPRQVATLFVDNAAVTSPAQQARVLNDLFHKQCSAFPSATLSSVSSAGDAATSASTTLFLFDEITPEQVLRAIHGLPSGKSCGVDGVTNELLKLTADAIRVPLATIFSQSLREGVFLAIWKESILTPVPKPGKDLSQLASYRPIALLSCLSKLLERLVHEQLVIHCLSNDHLPDHQFGFLRGRSAEWQLLSVLESWYQARDRGHNVHAVFLDAAKAFDRVDHTLLLQTPSNVGI